MCGTLIRAVWPAFPYFQATDSVVDEAAPEFSLVNHDDGANINFTDIVTVSPLKVPGVPVSSRINVLLA